MSHESEAGHAGVELALGIGLLLLPTVVVMMAFGPWNERRVLAEAAAAEGARAAAMHLDVGAGLAAIAGVIDTAGLSPDLIRVGWCGATPARPGGITGTCPLSRGSVAAAEVQIWVPMVSTPWGEVGGVWVSGVHSEPVDLYRSIP